MVDVYMFKQTHKHTARHDIKRGHHVMNMTSFSSISFLVNLECECT